MTNEDAILLNSCIDKCAAYEVQTGMKTHDMRKITQQEAMLATSLPLKDIKSWTNSAKTAVDLVS